MKDPIMADRQFTEDTLVIATHNAGKMREIGALFAGFDIDILSAADLGLAEPDETETSFTGNAILKAREAAASRAFKIALPVKLVSVSSGSARPRSAADKISISKPANSAPISRILPALCVAMTSVSSVNWRSAMIGSFILVRAF